MRTSEAYFTPEEYITLERKAISDAEIVRSEYMNGKIIGRSSSNLSHNLITGNIVAELYIRLKSRECFVFANQMRVSIPLANSYFYPDIGIVCEEPRFEDDFFDILLNPIVDEWLHEPHDLYKHRPRIYTAGTHNAKAGIQDISKYC